ncbi:hypothetical protein ATANTOWER_025398 [Ataeniobius toweri]|uniref:Uncharacterized protein n=1 Tax=Ataeniobius toweri TaxID=208326 RepID=A0ABU7CG49_9TELE|nr:hypothetical protein [Ataeniobius toweri]
MATFVGCSQAELVIESFYPQLQPFKDTLLKTHTDQHENTSRQLQPLNLRTKEFGPGPADFFQFFMGFSYNQHTRHISTTYKTGCNEWTVKKVLQHAATMLTRKGAPLPCACRVYH